MKYNEYTEITKRGSADFPLQYYYVSSHHPQYEMRLHRHREFEIIRIIDGEFSLYIDNIEYAMQKGDIAIVECGFLHRGEPKNCIYECVVFDLSMLRKRHNDILSKYILPIINGNVEIKRYFKSGNGEFFKTINELFITLRGTSEYYQLKVYSLLYNLFGCLYSSGFVASGGNRHNAKQVKVLTELLEWIDQNYNEQITLKDLSRVSGMNEKYLCRFFKEYTSRTPIDYINNLRIEAACHELTAGGMTITEAAIECGFNDLSYFSKAFKKYKGITPREYAKENS